MVFFFSFFLFFFYRPNYSELETGVCSLVRHVHRVASWPAAAAAGSSSSSKPGRVEIYRPALARVEIHRPDLAKSCPPTGAARVSAKQMAKGPHRLMVAIRFWS